MTEDFVVSCWPIPAKKPRQNPVQYRTLLDRIAQASGGVLVEQNESFAIGAGDPMVYAYPGDVLCQKRSGKFGVRRAK